MRTVLQGRSSSARTASSSASRARWTAAHSSGTGQLDAVLAGRRPRRQVTHHQTCAGFAAAAAGSSRRHFKHTASPDVASSCACGRASTPPADQPPWCSNWPWAAASSGVPQPLARQCWRRDPGELHHHIHPGALHSGAASMTLVRCPSARLAEPDSSSPSASRSMAASSRP